MPVGNIYDGDHLFDITYEGEADAVNVVPCYEESMEILERLFPKDKPIFLMCGAGGYATMTRSMLTKLGWDPNLLYNIGGAWGYDGDNKVNVVGRDADGNRTFNIDGLNILDVDFSSLTPIK